MAWHKPPPGSRLQGSARGTEEAKVALGFWWSGQKRGSEQEENLASSESVSMTGKELTCGGRRKKLPRINDNDLKCQRLCSQTLKHPSRLSSY